MNNSDRENKFPNYIPHRISAALSYYHLYNLVKGNISCSDITKHNETDKLENATRDAALKCLTNYFNGESDFGDCPVSISENEEKLERFKKDLDKIHKDIHGDE